VNVGTDHDTAQFAVESLRRWWNAQGCAAYPRARRLLVTADAGGSNGYRRRAWKTELAALALETGLAVTVCHFPPGTCPAPGNCQARRESRRRHCCQHCCQRDEQESEGWGFESLRARPRSLASLLLRGAANGSIPPSRGIVPTRRGSAPTRRTGRNGRSGRTPHDGVTSVSSLRYDAGEGGEEMPALGLRLQGQDDRSVRRP
jgi:Rhodopirellula transposase DDE domain